MPVPVVIEVALNGATQPARNRNVPTTPGAIAEDAIRCIEAGASIVHAHTPIQDFTLPGKEAAERYLAIFQPILAAHPDALLYPTIGAGVDMTARLEHVEHLTAAGVLRIGLFDPGTLILGWAGEDGLPAKESFLYVNTYADMEVGIEQCERLGLGPSLAIYEPGFLRNVFVYQSRGKLPRGAMVKLYFGGDSGYMGRGKGVTFGLPPTGRALDAYLEMMELAQCDLPWSVAVMGGDLLATPVARLALERGGHLHVGLEDHLGADQPTNVELVAAAADLCGDVGRPVATRKQVGEILRLPR